MPRRQIIFLVIVIILAAIVLVSILLVPSPKNSSHIPSASPSFKPVILPSVMSIYDVPFTENSGVSTESAAVKQSAVEITKINSMLPVNQEISLSTGKKVTVVIPEQKLQLNAWTLTIQIFDLNYQLTETSPKYAVEKASFREAASIVFDMIKKQGADPSKIIISWGDRAYIQQKAELWLKD